MSKTVKASPVATPAPAFPTKDPQAANTPKDITGEPKIEPIKTDPIKEESIKDQFRRWLDQNKLTNASLAEKKKLYAEFKKDLSMTRSKRELNETQQAFESCCEKRILDINGRIRDTAIERDPKEVARFFALLYTHLKLDPNPESPSLSDPSY